jgi:hypothetical protein
VPGAPAAVADKLMEVSSACLLKDTEFASSSSAGGIHVYQTINTHWTSEDVNTPDGHWVALRMDSNFVHGVPIAVELRTRSDGNTDAIVYRADKAQAQIISDRVIDGSLLCKWKDISYPYD